jgi:hypothetical protein
MMVYLFGTLLLAHLMVFPAAALFFESFEGLAHVFEPSVIRIWIQWMVVSSFVSAVLTLAIAVAFVTARNLGGLTTAFIGVFCAAGAAGGVVAAIALGVSPTDGDEFLGQPFATFVAIIAYDALALVGFGAGFVAGFVGGVVAEGAAELFTPSQDDDPTPSF